jgi:hypothetical protein
LICAFVTVCDQSSALRRRLQLVQLAFDALKVPGFNHPPHLAQAQTSERPFSWSSCPAFILR